jgi:hypothetical protein
VRESRCGVDGAQDEVVLLGLGVPPSVPGGAEGLAAGDELPLLGCGFVFKAADQRGPFAIALDVADVEVVEVAEGTGQFSDAGQLFSARVGRFEAVAVRVEGGAAVGVEQLRGKR